MSSIETTLYIKGFDKTQDAFRSLHKNLKKTSDRVGKMKKRMQGVTRASKKMAVVGGLAFGAIVLASKKLVKAYQEQERAEVRLETLVRNVAKATGKSVDMFKDEATWLKAVNIEVNKNVTAMKAQAIALQKIGVIGDEVTIFGQSQLATFALQTDAIQELTPAMLDMVVATKGINATQQDMIDIGNMLGKVMGGQVGALSRVGVVFNEAQGEILKTGTEMEKATALAQILNENFGGLNESARATSEGGMKALQNTFGDLQEKIGKTLVPLLAEIVNKMQPVIEKVMAWVDANPELTKKIILVTAGIAGLLLVLSSLVLVLAPIVLTLVAFAGALAIGVAPLLAIIALIVLISVVFIRLALNWREHWDNIKWAVGVAGDVIAKKFAFIKNALATMITGAKNILKDFANFFIGIAEGIANSWIKAVNVIIKALNKIQVSIPDWVPKIGGKSFGINIPLVKEVGIPRLAEGGIATKSILANIGEAGPEAIIPLNRLGDFGLGGNITVHIDTYIGEDDFAEKIGDKLAMTLMRNQQIQV